MTCIICNQIVDAAYIPKHLIKIHGIVDINYMNTAFRKELLGINK